MEQRELDCEFLVQPIVPFNYTVVLKKSLTLRDLVSPQVKEDCWARNIFVIASISETRCVLYLMRQESCNARWLHRLCVAIW